MTTAAVHPNVALLNEVYAAFGSGDIEKAAGYWTPDCVHHYPGRSHLAGSHAGIESTIAFAGKMFELTQGQITMETIDVGASDDYAYALVTTSYAREGKRVDDMRFVNVVRFEDGKIAEFWTYPADQYAIDEFWG